MLHDIVHKPRSNAYKQDSLDEEDVDFNADKNKEAYTEPRGNEIGMSPWIKSVQNYHENAKLLKRKTMVTRG